MKLVKSAAAGLIVAFALAVPNVANAGEQALTSNFSLTPQGGQFFSDAFTPSDWVTENSVATVDPNEPVILPSKKIDLTLPPSSQLTFNPGNMPVCPQSDINPGNVSVPVPTMVARCPDALIGNGTAKLVLNRNNLNPNAVLDGQLLAFNGGLQGGRPLVKIYAFSYYTLVGVYTEAALQTDGSLDFDIPQLTSDSSVSEFNLAIPSDEITLTGQGPGAETVVLPKGVKSDYVQAKCSTGSFNWASDFTFGTRDTDGTPISGDTFASDSGSQACSSSPAPTAQLTVTTAGTGKGVVVSDPAGINCGAQCQATLTAVGQIVTLTAQPEPGSTFAGWSGGSCADANPCELKLEGDTTVNARFGLVPPAGRVGVSINDGAKYTNKRRVKLSVIWPEGDATALLSNDGGFSNAKEVELTPKINWTLATSGAERLPKTVYVRFGDSTQTFTDDIILDETSPVIASASATSGGAKSSGAGISSATVSRKRTVKLRVKARDKTSGVSRMQVGSRKSNKLKKRKYKKKLKLRTGGRKLWVRVIDRAGNRSRWKRVKIRR